MEQPIFVPGDRPECIDSSNTFPALTQGRKYTIKAVKRNECCGAVVVYVGIESELNTSKCRACGCVSIKKDTKSWHSQYRFAFPEEVQQWENEINSALKGIPETL